MENNKNKQELMLSRRQLLLGASAGLVVLAARPALAFVPKATRRINLVNTHTGEKLNIAYWADGRYISGAMEEINKVLRDHRTGEVHEIDPRLIDQIALIHRNVDSSKPYEVISGYRSPASNSSLRQKSKGVAKGSLHMQGRAIDVRLRDRELTDLRDAALALGSGGVGFYRGSNFVHIDTGAPRSW